MKNFNYYQPTEIVFGAGRLNELGEIAKRFGQKCLLVSTPDEVLKPLHERAKKILTNAGMKVAHYNQVQPNPTVEGISAGAKMAEEFEAEVIIGLGGGSSMDSAKAIAVEATHEGTSWDYLFYKMPQPSEKTLPIIAITTTSGTGSQVTQVAVITNTKERDKSAISNSVVYPKVCIVDPDLVLTLPKHQTAATGFDAFCHAFEAMLHPGSSSYVNTLAEKAISLIVETLPGLLENLGDKEARAKMAFADTLAGLCIANAGVTLPHGVGMAISGMYPHIAHGESLSIIYPAFSRFTCKYAVAEFATIGRIFNPGLKNVSDEVAAEKSCEAIDDFIKIIGMWLTLKEKSVPEEEIPELAKAAMKLPDYKGNPRVATSEEMLELVKQSFEY